MCARLCECTAKSIDRLVLYLWIHVDDMHAVFLLLRRNVTFLPEKILGFTCYNFLNILHIIPPYKPADRETSVAAVSDGAGLCGHRRFAITYIYMVLLYKFRHPLTVDNLPISITIFGILHAAGCLT